MKNDNFGRQINRRIVFLFLTLCTFCLFSYNVRQICASDVVSQVETASNEKRPLTMERVFSGEFAERGTSLTWAPKGDSFMKQIPSKEIPGSQDVVLETPDGAQTVILSAKELIPRDLEKGDGAGQKAIPVSDYTITDDAQLVLIYTNTKRVWRRNTKGDYWIRDRKNDVFRKLGGTFAAPSSLQFAKISPDKTRVAYVYNNNLYVEEIVSGNVIQLTLDGNQDIINGTFDWVYEEEFDCRDGFRWSPDGKKIAFWRLDASREPTFFMLDDVGLSTVTGATRIENGQVTGEVNEPREQNPRTDNGILKSYPTLVYFKYPRVGCENADVKIGIVALPDLGVTEFQPEENTKFVDFNDSEEYYLPGMEWYEGRGGLIVQKTPRSQRSLTTYSVDPETATPTELFSESDPDGAWQSVTPIYPLRDGEQFLIASERDGWRRLYLASFDEPAKQTPITLENADVVDFVAFEYDDNRRIVGVYYYASPANATQRRLYRATLTGENDQVRIDESSVIDQSFPTNELCYETWSFSADSHWAICRRSAFGVPSCIDLVQVDGSNARVERRLETNASLRSKLSSQSFGKSEFIKVEIDSKFDFETNDSQENTKISLDAWIMYPPDWNDDDPKQYPALIYVYGEPASQTVVDSWGGSTYLYHRAIAERGCVVISIDGRGTPAPKGRQWRKCVYQKFGAVGRNDQAAALRRILSSTSIGKKIDANRIGVWGWSGGGTSTLNLLFNYPDLYKCGISVAPVPDYRNYDTIYQERYSGLITETPESYQLGSPIGYADKLEGRLLIVHGSGDDNCHFQTTERLINKLIAAGKDFETFVYPFRSHGIFEGAGTTLHLRNKMMLFWERNLFNPVDDK